MLSKLAARLTYANVIATLALFLALGGGAYAVTQPTDSTSGSVTACINRKHLLRVVSRPKCKKRERLLTWSKVGAAGAPGAQGAQGAGGGSGPQGPSGPVGAAGGDLAGSFPNPTIADGKVGFSKLAGTPTAVVHSTSAAPGQQIIPNDAGLHVLDAPLEDYDNAGMHSDATNSRITAPVGGLYQVDATVFWNSNTLGRRLLSLRENGSLQLGGERTQAATTGGTELGTSQLLRLAAGDYIEVIVDISGASAPLGTTVESFSLSWVGPGT